MKFLKGIGWGLGAILLALAVVVYGMVPEHATYVLAVGAFGLALVVAGLVLNRDRVIAALQGKKARAAGASAGYALTVLAVIVLVNFLSARHHRRFDLTETKSFSLSEQTVKILESLPREVTVTAFYREAEPTRQKLEDLLAEYRYHSPKLSVRYIDPDTHPGDAKRYGITEYGTIVVESGKNESRTSTPDEESLTNAMIKVTKDRERVVYFTTGHGERDETDPGLGNVLAAYGVSVRNDVVVDKVSRLFGGDYLVPLVPADGYDEFHPITKTFRFQTFFPIASSVEIKSSLPTGVTATKLAQTSPMSWAQPDNGELKTGHLTLKEGTGLKGPVPIAAAVTRKVDQTTPPPVQPASTREGESKSAAEVRLVVFGDSDFLSNGYFNASGNGDLALNVVAWLAEQEDLVSIRPKTSLPRIVILSPAEVQLYFWTIVVLAPLTIAIVGIGIWWRRKKL